MSSPTEPNISDRELERLRRAFQAPVETPEPDSSPPPEQIWDAVHGELEDSEVQELILHTAVNASSALEWRLALEMKRAGESDSDAETLGGAVPEIAPEGRVLPAAHRFRRVIAPIVGLAVAAMLLIVVGLPRQEAPPVEYRAGESRQIESLIPRGEALPRDAFVLRWSELEDATYSLVLSGADLQVLDQPRGLTEAIYQVPVAKLEAIEGELYWQVEAELADGSTVASKTFVQTVSD